MDGSISKEGAMLLPIKAPVIRRITGNTYKRKVTTSKGFVSSPITTWSPLLTFRVFLTAIIISFLPLWEVPQLSLEEQDSQVPDRIVLIQARDGFTSVTIPFSVIMNQKLLIRLQYLQSGFFQMPLQHSVCPDRKRAVQIVFPMLQGLSLKPFSLLLPQ